MTAHTQTIMGHITPKQQVGWGTYGEFDEVKVLVPLLQHIHKVNLFAGSDIVDAVV